MGAVYEAEQRPLGRRVAVKVLQEPPNSGDSDAFQRRFFLEAATLAKLDHPNTVTLYDYGQTKDQIFYLVMEYVDGPSLSKVLKKCGGIMEPHRVLTLMAQVTDALANAHHAGVVHRDLKPGNLLVTRDSAGNEQVKVVDFGLVKLTEGDQAITVTGMIMGSPHCMAPEQVQGENVDHRADVYAIGVLLFRCLVGHYPFHGSTTTATMIAHIQQPVPSLGKLAPDLVLPEGLEQVVQRCLAKDPKERFQDMRELGRVLRACIEVPADQFTTVSTLMEPGPAELPPPSKPPWALIAGLGALVAVLGLALFFSQRSPPSQEVPTLPAPPVLTTVSLNSAPSGATVLVEGERMGTTPLVVDLPAGTTQFELRLDGYDPLTLRKELVAGQPTDMDLTLSAVATPAPQDKPDLGSGTRDLPRPQTKPVVKEEPVPAAKIDPPDPDPAPATMDPTPEPEPPVKEDEAPAGYKSNPFD